MTGPGSEEEQEEYDRYCKKCGAQAWRNYLCEKHHPDGEKLNADFLKAMKSDGDEA